MQADLYRLIRSYVTMDSGIRDNCLRGSVGEFLQSRIREGSELSFVSAYFTIYAFQALRDKLTDIGHLNFLLGEPRFIQYRAAFEIKLKSYCERKGVWVKFSSDPRKIDAQTFWNAITKHVNAALKSMSGTDPRRPGLTGIQTGFADIEVFRKIVLNPLSHSAAASIAKAENLRGD